LQDVALPKPHNRPSVASQRKRLSPVASDVPCDFLDPEFSRTTPEAAGERALSFFEQEATMPKVAVNEDCQAASAKDDVWRAPVETDMCAEPDAPGAECLL
jgi:hypothetical protein